MLELTLYNYYLALIVFIQFLLQLIKHLFLSFALEIKLIQSLQPIINF